jgi:hypothetical protein
MVGVCDGRYVIAEAKPGGVASAVAECAATASREP